MDSYLWIAREILLRERRPLGPRAILEAAYRYGLVPSHLHGKTQHKTLQARISEDIIARRERSAFFRSKPGKFFLREFLADTSLPEEYRRPVATRRRIRELIRGPALAIDVNHLEQIARVNCPIEPGKIFNILDKNHYIYDDPKNKDTRSVFIWSFVSVRRDWEMLMYRVGRYRDSRDSFQRKQSIGFTTLVRPEDRSLFNYCDFGIVDSGVRAAKIDLDIPEIDQSTEEERKRASLLYFIWISQSNASDLLAVIKFECPDWFEPVKRRLALNDLRWHDTRLPVNNIDDFDPWSKSVLIENAKKAVVDGT